MKVFQRYQTFSNFPFPKHDIDPKEKEGKEFCLAFSKALFSRYVGDRTGVHYTDREKFDTLRAYGQGEQNPDKYKKWFGSEPGEGDDEAKSFININHEILSVAPKFKGYFRQRYKSFSKRPQVHSVDKMAGMERQDKEADAIFFMQEGKWIEEKESFIGQKLDRPEFVPSTKEELEIFKSGTGGFKSKAEIAYNFALSFTELISKYPDIADKMIDDIADINICVCRDYVNPMDGKVYIEYIDPARFVGFYSRNDNFTNSPGFGHFYDITIQQLREEAPWILEEELLKLAELYNNTNGNPNIDFGGEKDVLYDDGKWAIDDVKLLVFNSEFLTSNATYKTQFTSKSRKIVRFFDAPYGKVKNTETKKTVVSNSQMWYKCKWIIGTEHIFDYGKATDVPRPNKSKPKSSYHAWKIPGKSFIESTVVNYDQIQLAHIKMENALAKAAPDGLAIEYGSLQNITLGKTKMKPIELLRIRRIQGDLIYKATTHRGHYQGSAAKPVMELTGGAGKMLEEAIATMELHFNLIAEITGIDRHSIGVLPNSETSAAATKNAASGTGLIVMDMAQALNKVRETCALNVIHRVALRVKHSKLIYELYDPALGQPNLDILKLSADMTPEEMGITMMVVPNDEEARDINDAAAGALKEKENGAPGLEYPDYLFIKEQVKDGNMEYARGYLSMKLQKSQERFDKMTIKKMETQGDANSKTAVAKAEAETQRDNTKSQNKIKEIEAAEREKRITIQVQGKEDRKTEKMKADNASTLTIGEKLIDNKINQESPQQNAATG